MNQINPPIRVHDFEDCTIHTYPYGGMNLTIADYLIAAFSEAEEINVLVGYFRVSFFQALAPVLAIVYHSKKRVKIICGHQLSEVELQVLYPEAVGKPASAEDIDELVKSIWNTYFTEKRMSAVEADTLVLLHHLIEIGQVQVKPVFVKSGTTSKGLFHQKEYLFKAGDWLSRATGSANMTASGVSSNSESLDVRLENLNTLRLNTEERLRFADAVWTGREQNHCLASKEDLAASVISRQRDLIEGELDVADVSKRLFERVRQTCSTQGLRFVEESPHEYPVRDILPIENIKLRKHQEKAIEKWHEWGHVGLFEMATGAGKTITALRCLWELEQEQGFQLPVVILVPSKALIDQWFDVVSEQYPGRAIVCSSGKNSLTDWQSTAEARIRSVVNGTRSAAPVILGYHTTVLKWVSQLNHAVAKVWFEKSILIVDECHSLGAPEVRSRFPKNLFSYRIGLSATPERYFDDEGSLFVLDLFHARKGSSFCYSLKDAIDDEYLTPYTYEVLPFKLDEQSHEEYLKLTNSIVKCGDPQEGTVSFERRKSLLIKRARLVSKSPAKEVVFSKWVEQMLASGYEGLRDLLVYAPVGFTEADQESRVIDRYVKILSEQGIRVAKFVGQGDQILGEDSKLDVFRRGHLDALVAMKCLDEGVDLPRARCGVFLASTGNPREFIQRRGRLLRTFPGKSVAHVVDFLCLPYRDLFGAKESLLNLEQGIVMRDLRRMIHFSKDAINGVAAEASVKVVLQEFGLHGVWGELMNELNENE